MRVSIRWSIALAAILAMGGMAETSRADLVTGLRNYWDLDSNSDDKAHGLAGSASTVADVGTISGANGTDGISFAPGIFGDAIELNGATGDAENDGYVRVARSADTLYGTTSTLTTSAWVKAAGFDTGWQTIIAHGEGSQYRIARRGEEEGVAYAGGSGDTATAGPSFLDNSWHHIVAISESGVNTRLFVDGTQIVTSDPPTINDQGNSSPADPDLFIGANPQTGANNREWWGQIDDVAQWDRALSDDEIAQIYRGGADSGLSLGQLVPEPSSSALLILGMLGFGRRRRKP